MTWDKKNTSMNEVIFYEIEKEKWCEVKYLDNVCN